MIAEPIIPVTKMNSIPEDATVDNTSVPAPQVEEIFEDILVADSRMGDVQTQTQTQLPVDHIDLTEEVVTEDPSTNLQTNMEGVAETNVDHSAFPIRNLVGMTAPSTEEIPDEGKTLTFLPYHHLCVFHVLFFII